MRTNRKPPTLGRRGTAARTRVAVTIAVALTLATALAGTAAAVDRNPQLRHSTLGATFSKSATAPASTAAEGDGETPAGMPVIVTPAPGEGVPHDARRPVVLSYVDAEPADYRVGLNCIDAPDMQPAGASVTERFYWTWNNRDWQEEQVVHVAGGLPPGYTCTTTVRRIDDTASYTATFEVIWGDSPMYLHPVEPNTVWPATEDGGETADFIFDIAMPGDYEISVNSGGYVASREFNGIEAGRYSWAWNGRDYDGKMTREAGHLVYVDGRIDDEWVTSNNRRFDVKLGASSWWGADNYSERGSDHVDVDVFTLRNGPSDLRVRFDFYRLDRRALFSATAAVDVNQAEKGYLVSVRRKSGKLVGSLSLAYLASDVGAPKKIRCPGMETRVAKKVVTMSVPRSCMKVGGRSARVNYFVSDRHYHYDGGPTNNYWTPWVTYEVHDR